MNLQELNEWRRELSAKLPELRALSRERARLLRGARELIAVLRREPSTPGIEAQIRHEEEFIRTTLSHAAQLEQLEAAVMAAIEDGDKID